MSIVVVVEVLVIAVVGVAIVVVFGVVIVNIKPSWQAFSPPPFRAMPPMPPYMETTHFKKGLPLSRVCFSLPFYIQ